MNKIEIIYNKIASIICFLCHGKCCREGMIFELKNNMAVLKEKDYYHCRTWNTITGRCKGHDRKRPIICEVYKCKALNLLSRLLGLKVWKGEYNEDN